MKKILLIAAFGLFAFASNAQSSIDEIKILQTQYGLDKKQLVVMMMKFSEEESAKFWTIYDKYEVERLKLGQNRVDGILDYAKNYDKMTDEKASELVNKTLDNHAAFAKLQQ